MTEPRPLLVQTGGGFSLRYGDRWLYSRYQPQLAAEKAALDICIEPDTLYLLVSPCLSHGLESLVSRLPKSSTLFGVEFDPSLLSLAQDAFSALQFVPSCCKLATSTSVETILAEAAGLGKFRKVKEVRLSGGRDLYPKEYDALVETITLNNRVAWRNRMTLVRLGRLWVKNVIANLATLPWEQVMTPLSIQKPVMLCGAGPSLDHVLSWIKKHSGNLTILAVDTAAGTLIQAGIIPDQVVCLEAQAHNLPDFTPLAGLELTLKADISAHPASFRIVKGPKNLVCSQWMDSRFLDRLSSTDLPIQPVPPLGSVGVLAARLAVQQGQAIFIAGLDFAFLPAQTHCTGTPSDLSERYRETRLYKYNRNWALSFGHGVVQQPGASLGTAILAMYAACARLELNASDVYDLRGGFGLPLPAQAISLKQADELLASRPVITKPAGDKGTWNDPCHTSHEASYRNTAKTFLENELVLAEKLASMLRSGAVDTLEGIIKDCDYMYAHFPDPERVETMEIDALKRLAAEAGYWRARLLDALAMMQS